MTAPTIALTERHPTWCQNSDGVRNCACADEDYLVIHSRGAQFVPARDTTGQQPIDIAVDLCRVLRRNDPTPATVAEIVIPGGHAELDRAQLRTLIAELRLIDDLWDL